MVLKVLAYTEEDEKGYSEQHLGVELGDRSFWSFCLVITGRASWPQVQGSGIDTYLLSRK